MEFPGFVGAAYLLDTPNAACSKMLNCQLSTIEQGPRKGKLRLRGIPGMPDFATLPDAPLRGMIAIDGGNRLFAVAGQTVFEVFLDGTYRAATGFVSLNQHPAIMETNGFELMVASGGQLYKVEGTDGSTPAAVSAVEYTNPEDGAPAGLIKAATITFLKNRFIASLIDTKQLVISNLAPAGAVWDAADTAFKEGYPDNVCRVMADNEQLWVWGFDTLEVWQPSTSVFPYDPIPGAVVKIGCSAPYSPAAARGYRFWLWNNVVYGAYGIDPQRISDAGVERALRSYATTADAECWCQVFGQSINYVMNFPSAKRAWVYDLTHKAWHERGLWANGQQGAYRGRVYARAFGKDLVGDPENGKIYWLDENTYTDAGGAPLRRQRTADYIQQQMKNIRYNQLTIDADTGVGLDVAPDEPGYNPVMLMRYSDNRGKTWSSDLEAPMGRVGEDDTRIVYDQLGSSRIGKTFEVVVTDPVEFSIMGAYLETSPPEQGRGPT